MDEDDDESSGHRQDPNRSNRACPRRGVRRVHGDPAKLVESSACRPKDGWKTVVVAAGPPAPRDAGAATHKTVVFNDRDEYSDAPSAPVDADSVVEELQNGAARGRSRLKERVQRERKARRAVRKEE